MKMQVKNTKSIPGNLFEKKGVNQQTLPVSGGMY